MEALRREVCSLAGSPLPGLEGAAVGESCSQDPSREYLRLARIHPFL